MDGIHDMKNRWSLIRPQATIDESCRASQVRNRCRSFWWKEKTDNTRKIGFGLSVAMMNQFKLIRRMRACQNYGPRATMAHNFNDENARKMHTKNVDVESRLKSQSQNSIRNITASTRMHACTKQWMFFGSRRAIDRLTLFIIWSVPSMWHSICHSESYHTIR